MVTTYYRLLQNFAGFFMWPCMLVIWYLPFSTYMISDKSEVVLAVLMMSAGIAIFWRMSVRKRHRYLTQRVLIGGGLVPVAIVGMFAVQMGAFFYQVYTSGVIPMLAENTLEAYYGFALSGWSHLTWLNLPICFLAGKWWGRTRFSSAFVFSIAMASAIVPILGGSRANSVFALAMFFISRIGFRKASIKVILFVFIIFIYSSAIFHELRMYATVSSSITPTHMKEEWEPYVNVPLFLVWMYPATGIENLSRAVNDPDVERTYGYNTAFMIFQILGMRDKEIESRYSGAVTEGYNNSTILRGFSQDFGLAGIIVVGALWYSFLLSLSAMNLEGPFLGFWSEYMRVLALILMFQGLVNMAPLEATWWLMSMPIFMLGPFLHGTYNQFSNVNIMNYVNLPAGRGEYIKRKMISSAVSSDIIVYASNSLLPRRGKTTLPNDLGAET